MQREGTAGVRAADHQGPNVPLSLTRLRIGVFPALDPRLLFSLSIYLRKLTTVNPPSAPVRQEAHSFTTQSTFSQGSGGHPLEVQSSGKTASPQLPVSREQEANCEELARPPSISRHGWPNHMDSLPQPPPGLLCSSGQYLDAFGLFVSVKLSSLSPLFQKS